MSGVTEKYLRIEEEIKPYRSLMIKASDSIMDQEISSYPIFVVSQLEVQIGVALVGRDPDEGQNWFIQASTLEELNAKNIVHTDKLDEFRKVYKDPSLHLCLFVLSDLGAQFIFLPRE